MNRPAARPADWSRPTRHPRTFGPQSRITEDGAPACCVLVAAGPIDIAGIPTLAAALNSAIVRRRRVLVDMSGVTFMAEAGVAVLLDAHNKLVAHGGGLALTGTNKRIWRLLQITGNDWLLRREPADSAPRNAATSAARDGDRTLTGRQDRVTP